MLRRAFEEIMEALPQGGGPGRPKILSPQESDLLCAVVVFRIREGDTSMEALEDASELSLKLFGKSVGLRTLQKALSDFKKRGNVISLALDIINTWGSPPVSASGKP
jgi:hypothetical protein